MLAVNLYHLDTLNIERMQYKLNSLISPTLRCVEQDEKCSVT